jgi:hypothetical protein
MRLGHTSRRRGIEPTLRRNGPTRSVLCESRRRPCRPGWVPLCCSSPIQEFYASPAPFRAPDRSFDSFQGPSTCCGGVDDRLSQIDDGGTSKGCLLAGASSAWSMPWWSKPATTGGRAPLVIGDLDGPAPMDGADRSGSTPERAAPGRVRSLASGGGHCPPRARRREGQAMV